MARRPHHGRTGTWLLERLKTAVHFHWSLRALVRDCARGSGFHRCWAFRPAGCNVCVPPSFGASGVSPAAASRFDLRPEVFCRCSLPEGWLWLSTLQKLGLWRSPEKSHLPRGTCDLLGARKLVQFPVLRVEAGAPRGSCYNSCLPSTCCRLVLTAPSPP